MRAVHHRRRLGSQALGRWNGTYVRGLSGPPEAAAPELLPPDPGWRTGRTLHAAKRPVAASVELVAKRKNSRRPLICNNYYGPRRPFGMLSEEDNELIVHGGPQHANGQRDARVTGCPRCFRVESQPGL